MALTVDQSKLAEITENSAKLASKLVREELSKNCALLPEANGAGEVAKIFKDLLNSPPKSRQEINKVFFKLKLKNLFGRGLRGTVYSILKLLAYGYRAIKPYKNKNKTSFVEIKIAQTDQRDELHQLIKNGNPFEHLYVGASDSYKNKRIEIAKKAYRK
jgi:hypothetical protein